MTLKRVSSSRASVSRRPSFSHTSDHFLPSFPFARHSCRHGSLVSVRIFSPLSFSFFTDNQISTFLFLSHGIQCMIVTVPSTARVGETVSVFWAFQSEDSDIDSFNLFAFPAGNSDSDGTLLKFESQSDLGSQQNGTIPVVFKQPGYVFTLSVYLLLI
jgi:hypothetical protein